jgi:hypothetical protein
MKTIVAFFCLLTLCLAPISVFAHNKVVVVPLSSSKGSAVQHYRMAQQMDTSTNGCTTATFTTPDADIQAVITLNVSLQKTTAVGAWWAIVEYSTDGGTTWVSESSKVTAAGHQANSTSNTSGKSFVNLVPNSDYIFRIALESISLISGGQCELFITFNKKAASNVVTPTNALLPLSVEAPIGIGTVTGE